MTKQQNLSFPSLYRITLALGVLFSSGSYAEISDPIPLGPQPSVSEPTSYDYPPATQPYNPGASSHSIPVPHVPEGPEPSYTQPSFPPAMKESPEINHSSFASREELEKVAARCYGEIEQLWQHRQQITRSQMPAFQKSIGAAKAHCDELKKLVTSFEKADKHMNSFQKSLQKAQTMGQG